MDEFLAIVSSCSKPAETMASWKLTARFLVADEMPRWRKMSERCSWRSVCSLPLWLEIWPSEWGILRAVGIFSGEELMGGLYLTQRRRWGQFVLETHPMIPYTGFWLSEPEGALISKLESFRSSALSTLDLFIRQNASKGVLRLEPDVYDLRILMHAGWEVWPQYTYQSDLQVLDEGEKAFENDLRRQISAARDQGITVSESSDWTVLESLIGQMQQRKGMDESYPPGFLARLGEALARENTGTLFVAQNAQSKILAAALVGWVDARAIYLYGGSDESAMGTGAPSLLHSEILHWLRNHAKSTYDWYGANVVSVSRFKKNFNPQLIPYFVARSNNSLLGQVAHALHDAFGQWKRSGSGNEQ